MRYIIKSKSRKELILILFGILLSIFSYVYYFYIKNINIIFLTILCIIDFIFFYINAYTISKCFDKTKIFTILISILIMFGFILFFELFVILLSIDSTRIILSWDLVHKVFLIALFAGPSLIILLPVIWFVGECIS